MLLQQFINFIRSRKSVDLEELAAEFGLRVQVSTDPAAPLSIAGACLPMPATKSPLADRHQMLTLLCHRWLLRLRSPEAPSVVHGSQHPQQPRTRLDACADAVCRTRLTG